jgi:hypothetical protein
MGHRTARMFRFGHCSAQNVEQLLAIIRINLLLINDLGNTVVGCNRNEFVFIGEIVPFSNTVEIHQVNDDTICLFDQCRFARAILGLDFLDPIVELGI